MLNRMIYKFQFHNGPIKSIHTNIIPNSFICFNSTMVRLKAMRTTNESIKFYRFNSTMVRLKDVSGQTFESRSLVSIPQWSD